MDTPILNITGLRKTFAGVTALEDIDFEVLPGEIHCLAGENGSGKSTLIKMISGVHAPDKGTIEIAGKAFTSLHPAEAIAEGVQVIYQDFSIFPNLTVMENLALPNEVAAKRHFVSWKRVRYLAEKAISQIDFNVDINARLGDLSVADKQLVAICRALLQDARLLIMDEPTTALTGREVEALFKVVRRLQEDGLSILFVSHKLDEVFQISDRFTILRNGRKVVTARAETLDRPSFTEYMTGHRVSEERFNIPPRSEEVLLTVEGLELSRAFHNINFSLHRGEILGITGLLGSGRTELALSLFGVFPADKGRIRTLNGPLKLRKIADAIRSGIAYVPEDRLTEGLMLERSIGENIIIATIDDLTHVGWIDQSRTQKTIVHAIRELQIATNNVSNAVSTLSGGNQQRVVLAKWLQRQPRILILNGPTVGVDIGSKHEIHQILIDLAKRGMGIIVISDDIPELLQITGKILILRDGTIQAEVQPSDVSAEQLTELVSGGFSILDNKASKA